MKKHALKITILAVWAALLGWWWHESRSWPVPEKIEAAFLPDFVDHFNLSFGGQKVGWVYKSLRRQPSGDYQALQGTTIQVLAGGERPLEITFSLLANLGPSLALKDFRYLVQAGDLAVSETGAVAGRYLSVSVNFGEYAPLMAALAEELGPFLGERARLLDFREAVLPAPEGPALAAVFPPFLSHLGLTTGRNYALDTLDPISRTLVSANLRVEAETREYDPDSGRDQPVFKIRAGASGQETFLWIDRHGRTLREEGLGFALTRAYDLAEAMKDLTPLPPPAAFQRLLRGRGVDQLLKTIESLRAERDQQ